MNLILEEMDKNFNTEELNDSNIYVSRSGIVLNLGEVHYDISLILCDTMNFKKVSGQPKHDCIYGKKSNQLKNVNASANANFLTNKEVIEIVQWQKSLGLNSLDEYLVYFNNLCEGIKDELDAICDISSSEQFELISSVSRFYETTMINKNWVLIKTA